MLAVFDHWKLDVSSLPLSVHIKFVLMNKNPLSAKAQCSSEFFDEGFGPNWGERQMTRGKGWLIIQNGMEREGKDGSAF